MKKGYVTLALVFAVSAACALAACKKDAGSGAGQGDGKGDLLIIQLSNPDEALNYLASNIKKESLTKYLDLSNEIKTQDQLEICFNIGVKSANALLAVYKDDFKSAEALASTVQDAAGKLGLKTDKIAAAARQLKEALAEKDPKAKSAKVKDALNNLKAKVVAALNDLGKPQYSVAIEYGLWIESLRHVSGLLKDEYKAQVSPVLARDIEVKYFKEKFASIKDDAAKKFYGDNAPVLEKLQKDMVVKNNVIAKDAVARIFVVSGDVYKKYVK